MNFFKKYWAALDAVPQWVVALVALVVVLALNLLSVKVFGEMEFWFAMIKVVALVAFLVIGTVFRASSARRSTGRPSASA